MFILFNTDSWYSVTCCGQKLIKGFFVSAYGMLVSGGRAERQMDTPCYQLWFCMYFSAHSDDYTLDSFLALVMRHAQKLR